MFNLYMTLLPKSIDGHSHEMLPVCNRLPSGLKFEDIMEGAGQAARRHWRLHSLHRGWRI
jgi:hypothetical protein